MTHPPGAPPGDPKPKPQGPPTGPGRPPTWREVASAITTWAMAITGLTLLALLTVG